MPTRSRGSVPRDLFQISVAMASFGVGPVRGGSFWIGGAALESARSVDFQAAATFAPLPIDHLSVVSSLVPRQLLFPRYPSYHHTPPTADKYIRRGYLQTHNSTYTNHYSHININQTNSQIATATTNTHLRNRTKLQYISTPTVPSHITKNERPQPR
jgi:hypothetical protein